MSPPIDFPVHGVVGQWRYRWFEFFDGDVNEPTWGVRLGHRSGEAYVGLATLPRERYDRAEGDVPFFGTHWLINWLGAFGVRRDRSLPELVELMTAESRRHADWPRVRWTVDGELVPAAVWSFGTRWTAFVRDLPDVHLVAIGHGTSPEDLTCARLTDTTPYGFNLTEPLSRALLGRIQATHAPPVRTGSDEPDADRPGG